MAIIAQTSPFVSDRFVGPLASQTPAESAGTPAALRSRRPAGVDVGTLRRGVSSYIFSAYEPHGEGGAPEDPVPAGNVRTEGL